MIIIINNQKDYIKNKNNNSYKIQKHVLTTTQTPLYVFI